MTVSRLHGQTSDTSSFGPARVGRPTLVLLIGLRCYAMAAIGIAVYAFFRALHAG